MKNKNRKNLGFTLIEILVASVIMTVALVSTLGFFTYSLSCASKDITSAIAENAAEDCMEFLHGSGYLFVKGFFTKGGFFWGVAWPFDLEEGLYEEEERPEGEEEPAPNAEIFIYTEELEGAADSLMRVKVVICYRDRGGRIIGEDINLDGTLDNSEDTNHNGEIDSPCQIETVLVNKEM